MEVTGTGFYVFMVESPSPRDIYHGRTESELIQRAVELNGIGFRSRTAISKEAFYGALKFGLMESMSAHPDAFPLLHISAHGNGDGIQLSDGYVMLWEELKQLLRPVNQAFKGRLIVCMSSCRGYMGTRMAMDPSNDDLPYFALVGCGGEPTWSDTAVGYAAFYHHLCKGAHISSAVAAMKSASGNVAFFLEHAEQTRASFIDVLKSFNPEATRVDLEQRAEESAGSDPNVKNLEGATLPAPAGL